MPTTRQCFSLIKEGFVDEDKQKKLVTARLILSSLVMAEAPSKLIEACKAWCAEVGEPQQDNAEAQFTQRVGVSDTATLALVQEGGKKPDA